MQGCDLASAQFERNQECTTHELKTWNAPFDAILTGRKTFELRRADRPYRTGDTLWLREYDPAACSYSGRELIVGVTYILGGELGLREGYVCMGIVVQQASDDARTRQMKQRTSSWLSVLYAKARVCDAYRRWLVSTSRRHRKVVSDALQELRSLECGANTSAVGGGDARSDQLSRVRARAPEALGAQPRSREDDAGAPGNPAASDAGGAAQLA